METTSRWYLFLLIQTAIEELDLDIMIGNIRTNLPSRFFQSTYPTKHDSASAHLPWLLSSKLVPL